MQVKLTEYDPEIHRDYMSSSNEGGIKIKNPHLVKGIPHVFTLEVGKTCLVFKNINHMKEAKEFFEKLLRPSTTGSPPPHEHYWHIWYARLPKNILKASNRDKIFKAISSALIKYENSYSI